VKELQFLHASLNFGVIRAAPKFFVLPEEEIGILNGILEKISFSTGQTRKFVLKFL